MMLGFITSYVDHSIGEEITKPSMIAYHYLYNGLIIDFASIVPLWLMPLQEHLLFNDGRQSSVTLNIFRLFKIIRVRRLSFFITTIPIAHEIKNHLKRLMVIFYLILICHIQGCLLFLTVS